MQEIFIIFLYSYILGSIPFGVILSKYFLGKDIRDSGSGNIGATNVFRSGGKILGLITLTLDGLKGYLSILITTNFYQDYFFLSAITTFLAHLFPVWLKFKGGKGVATYLGILFATNILLTMAFIVSWFIIFIITKYSSLSSIVSSLTVFIINFYLNGFEQSIIFLLIFLLVLLSHKSNINRLRAGKEKKINL
tara:strand:+ start:103 stop:681 length:579 start_codon:yes stop_codon:yes gene_type:complete